MKLSLINVYNDDAMLKRVFSWLSRIGASPKFGSRPISWYQIHQCHAIDTLRAMGIHNPVCKDGMIMERGMHGLFISVDQLYREADTKSRAA